MSRLHAHMFYVWFRCWQHCIADRNVGARRATNSKITLEMNPAGSIKYNEGVRKATIEDDCTRALRNRCDIDVVSMDDITRGSVSFQKPFVIRGGSMKFVELWRGSRFKKKYGLVRLRLQRSPKTSYDEGGVHRQIKGAEFVDEAIRTGARGMLVWEDLLADPQPKGGATTILFGDPDLRQERWLGLPVNVLKGVVDDMRFEDQQVLTTFVMQGHGAGTGFHMHGPSVSGLGPGRKTWLFMVPEDQQFTEYESQEIRSKYSNLSHKQLFCRTEFLPHERVCTQGPGDVVFVPHAWPHATRSSSPSIGLAQTIEYEVDLDSQTRADHRLRHFWDEDQSLQPRLHASLEGGIFSKLQTAPYTPEEAKGWDESYADGKSFHEWSLGGPKAELKRIFSKDGLFGLDPPKDGLVAAVLGCGLGVEVDYLARGADGAAKSMVVVGVDFAPHAIAKAKQRFGNTPGVSFVESDVCKLPQPRVALDLIVDNTVYQNIRLQPDGLACYQEALRRISQPMRTVLHLNLMSKEGVAEQPSIADYLERQNVFLPLNSRETILHDFEKDWIVLWLQQGLYDLYEPGCTACNTAGGIPSWSLLLMRK